MQKTLLYRLNFEGNGQWVEILGDLIYKPTTILFQVKSMMYTDKKVQERDAISSKKISPIWQINSYHGKKNWKRNGPGKKDKEREKIKITGDEI